MLVVQMAGGMGTRMRPLTNKTPKSMLRIHDIPLMEHIFSSYPKEVKTVVMLVYPHQREMFQKYFGKKYKGKKIIYIPDKDVKNKKGNWQALVNAKKIIQKFDKFLFLCGDDVHDAKSLQKLIKYRKDAVLGFKHSDPKRFGVLEVDEKGFLKAIHEKPENPPSNLVSTAAWLFDKKLLDEKDPSIVSGEYRITEVIPNYLKHTKIKVIESNGWFTVGTPQEFIEAHNSPLFEQTIKFRNKKNKRVQKRK